MRMPRVAPSARSRHGSPAERPAAQRVLTVVALVAAAGIVAFPSLARADVVEQPADGFTLRCHGVDLRAAGGPTGGSFWFASMLADNPDGTTRYVETVTAGEVKLTDPASGAAYSIGGVDGSQGSTLDTLISGEQISGSYHARWIVRAADGAVVGDSETTIDYATGAVTVTGSCS